MRSRVANVAFFIFLPAAMALVFLWAWSFVDDAGFRFTSHGQKWELAYRSGEIHIDNNPQRKEEIDRQFLTDKILSRSEWDREHDQLAEDMYRAPYGQPYNEARQRMPCRIPFSCTCFRYGSLVNWEHAELVCSP